MMNFPSTPVVDQTYTLGDTTWKWNSRGWEIESIAGSGNTGFRIVLPLVPYWPATWDAFSFDIT